MLFAQSTWIRGPIATCALLWQLGGFLIKNTARNGGGDEERDEEGGRSDTAMRAGGAEGESGYFSRSKSGEERRKRERERERGCVRVHLRAGAPRVIRMNGKNHPYNREGGRHPSVLVIFKWV